MSHRPPPGDGPSSDASPSGLLDLDPLLTSALADAEAFANREATLAAVRRLTERRDGAQAVSAEQDGAAPVSTPLAAGASQPPEVQLGPAIRGVPARDGQLVALQAQVEQWRQRAAADADTVTRLERDLELARADLRVARQRVQRVADQLAEAQRRAERCEADIPPKVTRRLLLALLPALDAQHAAHTGDSQASPAQHMAWEMVAAEWRRCLAGVGVEAFDAIGQRFDPIIHEAISTQATDTVRAGTVLRQVGRGYLWEGRVLRPAQVVVAAAPES